MSVELRQEQTLTLEEQIAMLKAENEKLKASQPKPKSGLKVSAKGAVSMYGLGRFPVTLYAGQWEKLLDKRSEVLEFIQENSAQLTRKEA